MGSWPSETCRTRTRKFRKFKDGAEARPQFVTEPAELGAAMRACVEVCAKSWKIPEPYRDLVPGRALTCAKLGWLRLGIVRSGDTLVVSQFWFTINRRAYIYKVAYDEAFSRLSAGAVLCGDMLRQALEVDRVIKIDTTGNDPYKRVWMTHRRRRVGVIATSPRTWRPAAQAAYEVLGQLRQRLRPGSGDAAHGHCPA